MALLKHGQLTDDPWVHAGDAGSYRDGHVILSLAAWLEQRERWLAGDAPVGVRLASHEAVEDIAGDLDHLAVVALEFPKFTDGRAYSSARLLRQRYGYAGEIRAVGQVLRDQYAFMRRAGIDAFEIPDDADLA
ncbi:MAG TPA: DUF934 domain-containing protein, partial [Alphaproteobacteria bacterium]|nr:DUF934 domain-containing protein [Alphaproteobacteria bacterium]